MSYTCHCSPFSHTIPWQLEWTFIPLGILPTSGASSSTLFFFTTATAWMLQHWASFPYPSHMFDSCHHVYGPILLKMYVQISLRFPKTIFQGVDASFCWHQHPPSIVKKVPWLLPPYRDNLGWHSGNHYFPSNVTNLPNIWPQHNFSCQRSIIHYDHCIYLT